MNRSSQHVPSLFNWIKVRRTSRPRETHDVIDIQLSAYNVCPMARCIVVHKNKFSTKLSHLGDNEGSDDLVQIPLGIHSPHPKDVQVSTSTCPDTCPDHQTGP